MKLGKFIEREMSKNEQKSIFGGNTMIILKDSHGYTWKYTFNDAGDLIAMEVSACSCKTF